jgi:integrase
MKRTEWKQKWNSWVDPRPCLPGVYRRKEGGHLVRGRFRDPHSGKKREIRLTLPEVTDPRVARRRLLDELEHATSVDESSLRTPLFCDYAVSLLERKIMTGEIKSAQGRQKWGSTLEHHLIPRFGVLPVNELRRQHIESWRAELGKRIHEGNLSPNTANTWLAVLRVIVGSAVAELELERNPMLGVKPFDTSEHETYSEEEPNSLEPEEAVRFLAHMRVLYPQYFAITALGVATGSRPSSLRPLRRRGDKPDVLWDEGVLLIRRSQTVGEEVMNTTKTKRHQRLSLPDELMEILRWHVAQLPEGPMQDSDLLFPSTVGGFLSRSALDKPFRAVAKAMGLEKRVTPRAMRRTFQDLARAAEVSDVVTRAVSGHATEAMQRRYSTVSADEMRLSLARVVSLAQFRQIHEADPQAPASGVRIGVRTGGKTKNAG